MDRFLAAAKDNTVSKRRFIRLPPVVLAAGLVTSGLFFMFAQPITACLFNNDITTAAILPLTVFFACLHCRLFLGFSTGKKVIHFDLLKLV